MRAADFRVGDLYYLKHKTYVDSPPIFGRHTRIWNGMMMFQRVDLPGENDPAFDPYEPREIGARFADYKIYKAVPRVEANTDPVVINSADTDPVAALNTALRNLSLSGGARRKKTYRKRKGARKHTRKHRRA